LLERRHDSSYHGRLHASPLWSLTPKTVSVSESDVLGAISGFRRFRRRLFPFVVVFSEYGADEARLPLSDLGSCSLCSMTTPARHLRAAPRGGTHARRRHDRGRRRAHARDARRGRRRAHARDARRWHVRDGGGPATVICARPRCAPSTAPPMWSRSASPAAGIAL
jgi:hypothetical protein